MRFKISIIIKICYNQHYNLHKRLGSRPVTFGYRNIFPMQSIVDDKLCLKLIFYSIIFIGIFYNYSQSHKPSTLWAMSWEFQCRQYSQKICRISISSCSLGFIVPSLEFQCVSCVFSFFKLLDRTPWGQRKAGKVAKWKEKYQYQDRCQKNS